MVQPTKFEENSNPLLSLTRKPKLYLELPSQGKFWSLKSLNVNSDNRYEVFSMTARDEISLKNPISSKNGSSLISVVKSCIPAIKDPLEIPAIDLDAILVAIRIATYGNIFATSTDINKKTYQCDVDLNILMRKYLDNAIWESDLKLSDSLTVTVKPLSYKNLIKSAYKSEETQKILLLVNDDNLSEDQKIEKFKKSFNLLSDITVETVSNSIDKIMFENNAITNERYIKDFIEQCDRDIFTRIKDFIDNNIKNNTINTLMIDPTSEMIEDGIKDQVEVKLEFTPVNFFK